MMLFHMSINECLLNDMYASIAFSDTPYIAVGVHGNLEFPKELQGHNLKR